MKTLKWTEIEENLRLFVARWWNVNIESERGNTQEFWSELFACYGVDRRYDGVFFEKSHSKKNASGTYFSDVFWPSRILVEQKLPHIDIKIALEQARKYYDNFTDKTDLPYYLESLSKVALSNVSPITHITKSVPK